MSELIQKIDEIYNMQLNDKIKELHPNREIALEVVVDMLSAALADARHILDSVNELTFASPPGQNFKANCRSCLDRTSEQAMFENHPNHD